MKKRWLFLLEVVFMLLVCGLVANIIFSGHASKRPDSREIKAQMAGMKDGVDLFQNDKGELRFLALTKDGKPVEYTPEQFARLYYDEGRSRASWEKLMNISSPEGIAWVMLGLFGQILFTGRMVVQLLASEKEKKSVVPPAFWWMSLLGASMLLIYFGWRRDPVGLLGQSFGWFIYVRNLYLIYAKNDEKKAPATGVNVEAAPALRLEN